MDIHDTPTPVDADELLSRLVFVRNGSLIADTANPDDPITLRSARRVYSNVRVNGRVPVIKHFLENKNRPDVNRLVFEPDQPLFFEKNGQVVFNTWKPIVDDDDAAIDGELWDVFQDYVCFLFGDRADAFLSWLADVIQHPGERSNIVWVHTAKAPAGERWLLRLAIKNTFGNYFGPVRFVKNKPSQTLINVFDDIGASGRGRRWSKFRDLGLRRKFDVSNGHVLPVSHKNVLRVLVFSDAENARSWSREERLFEIVEFSGKVISDRHFVQVHKAFTDPRLGKTLRYWLNAKGV